MGTRGPNVVPDLIFLLLLAKTSLKAPDLCVGMSIQECIIQTPTFLHQAPELAFMWILLAVWMFVSEFTARACAPC